MCWPLFAPFGLMRKPLEISAAQPVHVNKGLFWSPRCLSSTPHICVTVDLLIPQACDKICRSRGHQGNSALCPLDSPWVIFLRRLSW